MRRIIIGLIILIILVGLGSFVYYYYFSKGGVFPSPSKEEISEKAQPEPPKVTLPKVLYNLAGTIQKLEKDTIFLEASIPQLNEAGEPVGKQEMRKVKISKLTKFSQLTFIEIEPGRKTPQETPITFKNLKIGDYIDVISNQDISRAEEFEATQIRVLPK